MLKFLARVMGMAILVALIIVVTVSSYASTDIGVSKLPESNQEHMSVQVRGDSLRLT